MSKPVTRLGDVCSGHDTHEPRQSVSGSDNVFINGKPTHRLDDDWEVHGTHSGKLSSGSSSVYVNGKPIGRIGDSIDCGSVVATG